MSLKIVEHYCPQNHRCPAVMVCPVDALSQIGESAPSVNNDKCIDCGKCVQYCPIGALQLEKT